MIKTFQNMCKPTLITVLAALSFIAAGCVTTTPTQQPAESEPSSGQPQSEMNNEQPLSRTTLIEQSLSNTLTLLAYDDSGDEITQGSGFFIDSGRVVTNAHVVAGASTVDILDIDGNRVATAKYALHIDIENDLAVLPTAQFRKDGLPLATLPVQVGDDVWAFGAPLGLEGTTSTGIVSAFRDREGMELIQISAPISPGSSGGPVVNSNGEIVGIATMILTGGQNLNFAVPANRLLNQSFTNASRASFPNASAFDNSSDEEFTEAMETLLELTTSPSLAIGQSVTGILDSSSLTVDGTQYSIYQFRGIDEQNIQIDVSSQQIDTVVEVYRELDMFEEESWFYGDDDSGSGTNSQILMTLPGDDTYYIFIYSYEGNYGSYTISVQEQEESDPIQVIELGQLYRDTLDLSGRVVDGMPYNVYRIAGLAGQTLQLDAQSVEFDTVLSIAQGTGLGEDSGWSVDNDDGDTGTDSRIITTLPASDTYYIFVRSYDEGMGEFTVQVQPQTLQQSNRSERWVYVTDSVTDDSFYYDSQTLQRRNGYTIAWILTELSSADTLNSGELYDEVKTLNDFDCDLRRSRSKSYSFSYSNEYVTSVDLDFSEQAWSSVSPGSVAEFILDSVCTTNF